LQCGPTPLVSAPHEQRDDEGRNRPDDAEGDCRPPRPLGELAKLFHVRPDLVERRTPVLVLNLDIRDVRLEAVHALVELGQVMRERVPVQAHGVVWSSTRPSATSASSSDSHALPSERDPDTTGRGTGRLPKNPICWTPGEALQWISATP